MKYLRAEAHLAYRTSAADATKVTFDWTDGSGPGRDSHVVTENGNTTWNVNTGKGVRTRWVELTTATR